MLFEYTLSPNSIKISINKIISNSKIRLDKRSDHLQPLFKIKIIEEICIHLNHIVVTKYSGSIWNKKILNKIIDYFKNDICIKFNNYDEILNILDQYVNLSDGGKIEIYSLNKNEIVFKLSGNCIDCDFTEITIDNIKSVLRQQGITQKMKFIF